MSEDDLVVAEECLSEQWRQMKLIATISKIFNDPLMSAKEKTTNSLIELAKGFGAKDIILVPGPKAISKGLNSILDLARKGELKSIQNGQAQIYNAREQHWFQKIQIELNIKSLILIPTLIEGEVATIIILTEKRNGEEYTLFEQTISTIWAVFANQSLNREVENLNRTVGQKRAKDNLADYIIDIMSKATSYGIEDNKTVQPEPERNGLYKRLRMGDDNEVAVLFADLRGFTNLTRELRGIRNAIPRMLNDFTLKVSEIIYRNNGIISKFIGDGVMCIFGADTDETNSPNIVCSNAVRAAIEIKRKFTEEVFGSWREDRNLMGGLYVYVPIDIGVGIAYGNCSLVELSYNDYHEYTAFGEIVNLAQRLESSAKRQLTYGDSIIMENNPLNLQEGQKYTTSSILSLRDVLTYCDTSLITLNFLSHNNIQLKAKDYKDLLACELRLPNEK